MENINNLIYEKAFYSFDNRLNPKERAINMIDFVNLTRTKKNRTPFLNDFYERNMQTGFMDYVWKIWGFTSKKKKEKFLIYSDFEAVDKYFYFSLNKVREKPLKTLENIEKFATHILEDFNIEKKDNIINSKKIKEIMEYLDNQYNFIEKIYKDFIPTFSILNFENPTSNSSTDISIDDKGNLKYHYIIFNVKNKNISPVYVFLHEIGHTIHFATTKNGDYIPEDILDELKETGFYKINSADTYTKCEVLADILAMGIMYNSPYADCDPFVEISEKDKIIFNKIIKKLFKLN